MGFGGEVGPGSRGPHVLWSWGTYAPDRLPSDGASAEPRLGTILEGCDVFTQINSAAVWYFHHLFGGGSALTMETLELFAAGCVTRLHGGVGFAALPARGWVCG